MMQDPDFEEHLDQLMRTFCMLMFEVCTLVKGIKDSDSETAWLGLCLIAALRGLFNSGVRVSMDCPVNALFTVQQERLKAATLTAARLARRVTKRASISRSRPSRRPTC